ncbi:MAG: hypothetical protein IPL95_11655 [Saprospiraceae bacterium]|nr:hypothetical protein [Saprospiraceae bacterium]
MKELIFTGWNIQRILKMIIGVSIVILSIVQKENLLSFLGGLLIFQSLFNTCSNGTCNR